MHLHTVTKVCGDMSFSDSFMSFHLLIVGGCSGQFLKRIRPKHRQPSPLGEDLKKSWQHTLACEALSAELRAAHMVQAMRSETFA